MKKKESKQDCLYDILIGAAVWIRDTWLAILHLSFNCSFIKLMQILLMDTSIIKQICNFVILS